MSKLPEIIKAAADPAAGGEIVYTADEDMIIHSLAFQLVTSASGGARTIKIACDDGTPANIFFHSAHNATMPISSSYTYTWAEGMPFSDIFGIRTAPLPAQGLRLRKGDRLRTITGALDPGDDFGIMHIQAERI